MKGFKQLLKSTALATQLIAVTASFTDVDAASFELLAFSQDGMRLTPGEINSNSIFLQPRFSKPCVSDTTKWCLEWETLSQNASQASLLQQKVTAVMHQLLSIESLDLEHQWMENRINAPLEELDAEVFSIVLAEAGEMDERFDDENRAILIDQTFSPRLQDQEADILGARILLDARRLPSPLGTCTSNCLNLNGASETSLHAHLLQAIAKGFLGLGASGISDSVMYPLELASYNKLYTTLSKQDELMMKSLYQRSPILSRLSGELINGNTGDVVDSGFISLVSAEVLDVIVDGGSVVLDDFINFGALVGAGGKFTALVEPGEYYVFVEPFGSALNRNLFNEYTRFVSIESNFDADFYDGRQRESNQENWDTSLRSIAIAAVVTTLPGTITQPVQLITQADDPGAAVIAAIGSNYEVLSPIEIESLDRVFERTFQNDLNNSKRGGGCQIATDAKFSLLVYLMALLMVFLVFKTCRISRLRHF